MTDHSLWFGACNYVLISTSAAPQQLWYSYQAPVISKPSACLLYVPFTPRRLFLSTTSVPPQSRGALTLHGRVFLGSQITDSERAWSPLFGVDLRLICSGKCPQESEPCQQGYRREREILFFFLFFRHFGPMPLLRATCEGRISRLSRHVIPSKSRETKGSDLKSKQSCGAISFIGRKREEKKT